MELSQLHVSSDVHELSSNWSPQPLLRHSLVSKSNAHSGIWKHSLLEAASSHVASDDDVVDTSDDVSVVVVDCV